MRAGLLRLVNDFRDNSRSRESPKYWLFQTRDLSPTSLLEGKRELKHSEGRYLGQQFCVHQLGEENAGRDILSFLG